MSSFGAGGKSSRFWTSAMKWTWLPRSSTLTPLGRSRDLIAVEVRGTLFEFGEVLDRLEGPLRAE